MNNLKNNIRRTPRQLARREPARGCEPSSLKLSSQLSSLFLTRLFVTDGDTTRTYTYHADGQLASASCDGIGRAGAHASSDIASQCSLCSGDMRTPQTETFLWDGLALIQRGDEQFMDEPHIGGGNPVASSKGTSYFNDALGTTVGSKSNGKYSVAALTAFGENVSVDSPTPTQNSNFFTGKPHVAGLGHAFLVRNYRASLGKWQTADPLGYPDGWNQLAYLNNKTSECIDLFGGWCESVHHDINETYLIREGISLHEYRWGAFSLDVLGGLNAGSDWTDDPFSDGIWGFPGNQSSSVAYMHAMSSGNRNNNPEEEWGAYRGSLERSARTLSDRARELYANMCFQEAAYLELCAVGQLGALLHTFDDAYSPSHSGFQEFSLWTALSHIDKETMSVYETGVYTYMVTWKTGEGPGRTRSEIRSIAYQSGGFRDVVYEAIRMRYADTINYVLRQPE